MTTRLSGCATIQRSCPPSDTRANHTGSELGTHRPLSRLVDQLNSKIPVEPFQALRPGAGQRFSFGVRIRRARLVACEAGTRQLCE